MSEDNKKEPQLVDQIISQIVPKEQPKPLAKEAKKQEKSPPIKAKLYYDVKVECMLPATLTFRVLAEDAEQAAELIRGQNPTTIKHRLLGRKDI